MAKVAFGLVLTLLLEGWLLVRLKRWGSAASLLQMLGAGWLVVVVLTHMFEARHLFGGMHWGEPHSTGHYLDLSSACLGVALLVAGGVIEWHQRGFE